MNNKNDFITIEDFNDELKELAEIIGVGNVVRIVERFQGNQIYISKHESILRKARDRNIRQDFNKNLSYDDIAIKYNLTPSRVRDIVHFRKPLRKIK